ncbi:MAG: ABC transporter permease [Acidobacteriia bacterium]|nr:ABC transporter permease [Terriglobia bacterium]
MLARIRVMIVKEFIQVIRDKRSLFLLLAPPLIQLLILGYAVSFEIRHVSTAVLDQDNSPESRDFVARFTGSRYFEVSHRLSDRHQLGQVIADGEAMIGIHIQAGFGAQVRKGKMAPVQVIFDGSNSNTALVALGFVTQVADNFARDYQNSNLERSIPLLFAQMPRVELQRRPLFNVDMQSRWNFIPGVIGILALIQVIVLTAFAVVREREIGTLEQIMVTPVRSWEFIIGKTFPFFLIGLADGALIALFGTYWFGIPFRGSVGVLTLGLVLFLFCVLGAGFFISTVSRTQQQALVSAFFFYQPAIIFSGFGFPISSMPPVLQWISYLDPLRYFEIVLRSVYLKGVGVSVLWPQMAAMAVFAPALFMASIWRFRKSID